MEWCECGVDLTHQEIMGYDLYAEIAVQKCVHVHILPSHEIKTCKICSQLKIFQFE